MNTTTQQDTQAAANKAAEEGGLLHDVKEFLGDMHAMPVEWTIAQSQVLCAKVSDAIEADRASRQVDNKAEVEPVREPIGYITTGDVEYGVDGAEIGGWDIDWQHKVIDAMPEFAQPDTTYAVYLEATPPATTGASTVLTDEQITILSIQCRMGNIDYENDPAGYCNRFARAIEREVAAQACQVAVPGWISVDERLPDSSYCLATYRNRHGKLRIIRAKYARQYEIDAGEDAIDQGNCEHNEADDTFYLKAGWLECIDNWDDYSSIYVTEGEVTHWMPLPAAPSPAKESK